VNFPKVLFQPETRNDSLPQDGTDN